MLGGKREGGQDAFVRLTNHGPSLVVEVAEDDVDALVLLAQEVLDGNLDIVKGDVAGSGGGRVGCLDGLGLDALAPLDENDTEALFCADTRHKVVAEGTVGDPLLGAIYDLEEASVSPAARGGQSVGDSRSACRRGSSGPWF